jgi:hypothetical protein
LFNEADTNGLGVNSASTPGSFDVTDFSNRSKLNLTEDIGPIGDFQQPAVFYGEAVTFSFDGPGAITAMLFDGVKDESFEFFRLETPGGGVISFFDAEIGIRISDISLISALVPNVTLLVDGTINFNDDLAGLSIPFQAGDEFRLAYGEYIATADQLLPGNSLLQGNGARWEGLIVSEVPEPATGALTVSALVMGAAALARRRSRELVLRR